MRVSFIITTRDEPPEILSATLDGLARTTAGVRREFIVVDDGSRVPVAVSCPETVLLRNAQPRGVSPSRRIGAASSTGTVLVWLDAHMSFDDGWLDPMLAEAESGALVCSGFWDYDLAACHCWGADYAWCGERDYWSQRYPGFGLRHRVERPGEDAVDVPMIIGACYMLSHAGYRKLGGFSPLFRNWGIDEQDLCLRAHLMKVPVRCATTARVGHLSRQSFPYQVCFEHLEYNQLVMIRSVFEEPTIERLERFFDPVPPIVSQWLQEIDLTAWRSEIQTQRARSDDEIFRLLGLTVPG
jgi:GT2 family glycosyltransferase